MEEEQLKQYNLEIRSFTSQGLRSRNEDRQASISLNQGGHLLLVADGMGGYDDGHLAAEIAIDILQSCLCDVSGQNTKESIELAFYKAHTAINKMLVNAGTTVGGVLIQESFVHIFWLGDVKIVLKNGDDLFASKEHTLLNLLRESDITIKPEEINRLTHTVVRSLGGNSNSYTPEIVTFQKSYQISGLISSDGLAEFYSNEMLVTAISDFDFSDFENQTVFDQAKDNVTGLMFWNT